MKLSVKIRGSIIVILVILLLFCSFSILSLSAEEINNDTVFYNCYAYAINRVITNEKLYYPNSLRPTYQPGEISKDYHNNFDAPYTLDEIKCNVVSDLCAIGHTGIIVYDSRNVNFNFYQMMSDMDFSMQELICFRVGSSDYHFMKYDVETNAWYHKFNDGSINKYTDNSGIPSNNVPWQGAHIYDSEIIYIAFNKLIIDIGEEGQWQGSVVVKGGEYDYSGINYKYCCGDEGCCNSNGICLCENDVKNGSKDVVYEIVVPESGYYSLEIFAPCVGIFGSDNLLNFNYEIYSYNMYNGNYSIVNGDGDSGQTFTQTVYLTAYDDYNDGTFDWKYETYKNYLRLYYDRGNSTNQSISVKITHQHMYTDHYESISRNKHKSYCSCGEYITESHQVEGDACVLCGAAHLHTYMYSWVSNTGHRVNCTCGYSEVKSHVVPADAFGSGEMFATCLLCNGRVTLSESIMSIVNLPRSENGSFILPNGVIILTDEDIESYMNGTLEFIYPEDDSVAL